jgi:hypothetical protein
MNWKPPSKRWLEKNDAIMKKWFLLFGLLFPALCPAQNYSINWYKIAGGGGTCQWKALPKSFGSVTAVHRRFQQWRAAGFFRQSWRAGLAEYDDLEGIAWEWPSIDGT